MKTLRSTKKWVTIGSTMAFVAIWIASGCASNTAGDRSSGAASTQPMMASDTTTKGGAELWAETCSRCHNIRPPEYYSDAQWDLIVHHMRIRANLTGAEAREIVKFLQASN
jgi:cytochrome c5